ncbi:MAG: GAF domain-containing protein [Chloroflexi bacterium]|nr:GAF domain-containing protein [Chloroflexota bacterium]
MESWSKPNTNRILVIGDDEHLVTLLKNILSGAGHYVQQAYTVSEACEMADQSHYDLALVDLRVSGNDVQAILEELREDTAFGRFPWIALMDHDLNPAVPDGASGVVLLPVRAHEMLNTVAKTLQYVRVQSPSQPLASDTAVEDDVYQLLARNLLEQKTLSDIARTLNSNLDLNTVLTKVVDAATLLTHAEEALLLLPDEDGRTLYIRAEKGIDNQTARQFRIKTRDTLAGQVFETGKPIISGDGGWRKLKTAYFVRSVLYVPLKVKEQVIGVLGVNNRASDRTFNNQDLTLLEDLASHAAIAIENARLYGETVTRTRELTTLFKTSEAVNSTLALDGVLPIITQQLLGALDVRGVEIATWDENLDELQVLASSRQLFWTEDTGPVLYPEQHATFEKVLQESLAIPADLAYAQAQHAHQVWLVPLAVDTKPIGILEVHYLKDHSDTLVEHLSFVKETGLTLIREVDPSKEEDQARARDISQDLLEKLYADFCRLWVRGTDGKVFHQRMNVGLGVWLSDPQPKFALQHLAALEKPLRDCVPLEFVSPTSLSPEAVELLNYYHAQSIQVLPLTISGRSLGLVILENTLEPRSFSEREINLAQALAIQAANALQNARLFHDLQKSLEELRRTQGKLVQSARMSAIGELSAAVAHQINNPLTTVLGDTEILMQDKEAEDPDMISLEAIHRAGQRAHEVVRRLLSVAQNNKEEAFPEPMDINATIENTLSLVTSHIRRKQVNLKIELASELPKAQGLRGQLEDVWLNLLLNARDAVKESENPTIGIRSSLSEDGSHVQVEVWDNGEGIPEEQRSAVFDAFFTTKASGEGTGLGLHICKQVVNQCHGTIQIQADRQEGVSFLVSLPVK